MLRYITYITKKAKFMFFVFAIFFYSNTYAEFINYLDIRVENDTDYNIQNISHTNSSKGGLLALSTDQLNGQQSFDIANFRTNLFGQLSQDLSADIYDSNNAKMGQCQIHIGIGSYFAKPDFSGTFCKLNNTDNHVQINPRYEIVNNTYKTYYKLSNNHSFSRIFVFGDSMSDNGNLYQRSVELSLIFPISPILPISPPYYNGRFTNGKVWVERLAEKLNISSDSLINYAYAGASVQKDILPVPNLDKQVNTYLNWNRTGDPYALYIVWMGSNDFVRHLDKPDQELIDGVITGIQRNLIRLINNGARHLLVPQLPDLSLVPDTLNKDQTNGNNYYSNRLDNLLRRYNMSHKELLAKLRQEFPEVKFITFDVYNFIKNTRARAHEYGFTYIEERCNLNSYWDNVLEVCEKPEQYVFWDGIHPSAKAHEILADLIFNIVLNSDYKPNYKNLVAKSFPDDVVIRNRAAINALNKDTSEIIINNRKYSDKKLYGAAAAPGGGLRAIIDADIPLY